MNRTTKTGIEIIEVSLILGIAGNLLLRTVPFGLNIALWVTLLVVGMIAVMKRSSAAGWNKNTISLYAGLVFFSLMFALFDSPELLFLDGLAIVLLFTALVVPALSYDITRAGVIHYAFAAFTSAISALFGAFALVGNDLRWASLPKTRFTRHTFSILRGIALAVPIGIVIGGLLMAADAAFQSFVLDTFSFDPKEVIAHVAISSGIGWGVLGYLRAAVFGVGPQTEAKQAEVPGVVTPQFSVTEHTTEEPDRNDSSGGFKKEEGTSKEKTKKGTDFIPEWMRLGLIETAIVLGLMNLLFVAFVIFQLPYLFGGMDLVQQTPDFKLAEYARRGVAELIMVSLLVLSILLSVHWLLKKDHKIGEKVFRILASMQIGLLFVIMLSATQRLSLLTGSLGYGQTAFRFYAYFFLIWLALVFVWFGMTVLRGMRTQFAYGALWSALFIIGMLHLVNPDDYIVRANVELMKQGRSFDAVYNANLSADAVPALVESLDAMSVEYKLTVLKGLRYQSCEYPPSIALRSWNWSRSASDALLYERRVGYMKESCR